MSKRNKKKFKNRNHNLSLYTNKKNAKSTKKETTVKKETAVKKETTVKKETKTYYTSSYYSTRKNYDLKGEKNKTKFPDFVNLCKPSQKELKATLEKMLVSLGYTELIIGDGYIYAKGEIPVLLTAHMDTVHKETVKDFYEYYDEENNQHIISSPQGIGGDDRCGVYMILEIIKTHKCSVLFCEDEEIGGIGSDKFCLTESMNDLLECKYLIELDRANGTDAVFYDCNNDKFTKFIEENTGYKEAHGSFSDISNLSPVCKIASVNLSCGYYNAHSTSEYVIVEEMLNTIDVVRKLLDVECEQYEYIGRYSAYGNYGGYRKYYDYDYDYDFGCYGSYNKKKNYKYDDYDDYYYGYYDRKKSTNVKTSYDDEVKSLSIQIYNEVEDEIYTYISNGKTEYEAFGKFFMNNPSYCYEDVFDYEWYDGKVCEDGWILLY